MHEPQVFSVAVFSDGAALTIRVAGELDLATAPDLAAALDSHIDSCTTDVIVDLGAVTFLDSSALKVFIGALRRLRAAGRRLTVSAVSPAAARVLEVAGLTDEFSAHPLVQPSGVSSRASSPLQPR